MATFAELVRARRGDDRVGLLFEGRAQTWAQVVREAERRAALAVSLAAPAGAAPEARAAAAGTASGRTRADRGPAAPRHIGVLLANVPEYVYWILGAAMAGSAVVGINPTRRGAELAADIRHTDCRFVVTDSAGARLLAGLDTGVPPERLLLVDTADYGDLPGARPPYRRPGHGRAGTRGPVRPHGVRRLPRRPA
jgi:fatty-acyl-CoA synthase